MCGIKKTVAILQGQNVGQTQAPNKKTGPYKLALLRMFSQQTFAFLLTHCGCASTYKSYVWITVMYVDILTLTYLWQFVLIHDENNLECRKCNL